MRDENDRLARGRAFSLLLFLRRVIDELLNLRRSIENAKLLSSI